jgi:hypothetical protein
METDLSKREFEALWGLEELETLEAPGWGDAAKNFVVGGGLVAAGYLIGHAIKLML